MQNRTLSGIEEINRLRLHRDALRLVIDSPNTVPFVRASARRQLTKCLQEINEAELAELERWARLEATYLPSYVQPVPTINHDAVLWALAAISYAIAVIWCLYN